MTKTTTIIAMIAGFTLGTALTARAQTQSTTASDTNMFVSVSGGGQFQSRDVLRDDDVQPLRRHRHRHRQSDGRHRVRLRRERRLPSVAPSLCRRRRLDLPRLRRGSVRRRGPQSAVLRQADDQKPFRLLTTATSAKQTPRSISRSSGSGRSPTSSTSGSLPALRSFTSVRRSRRRLKPRTRLRRSRPTRRLPARPAPSASISATE